MSALIRSRLPKGSRLEGEVWVAPNGRGYQEEGHQYRCVGVWVSVPKKRKRQRGGKLSDENVAFIKGQISAGANQRWLAKKFGVSAVTICNISKGKLWGEVESPIMELQGPPKGVHREAWSEYLPYDKE
jgi:hypothetical protein